jgi:RNA polymerase sigma-70 factor, ECF subfamily
MMAASPLLPAGATVSGPTAPACDEAVLVRRAADGDGRAFEQIVHAHHRRVYGFLHQLTRHRQDAEDITQQTFIKAHRHLAGFDCERPLINWLLTIARRTALNHFRSARRWEHMPVEPASGAPSPAHFAEQKDRAENLWLRARRTLSQREFEVLWLRFREDLSVEETARVMGLTRIHVKVLVHRARQHLLKGESSS